MSADLITESVDIPTADGVADAYVVCRGSGGPHPAVVLYSDAFGIRDAVRAHAQRLARHDYLVLVPNVLYRSGRGPVAENLEERVGAEDRSALFAELAPKMDLLTPAAQHADSHAWLAYLRGHTGVRVGGIGIVGYCLGGRLALRMAGEFPDWIAAAASFHGGRLATADADSPHLAAVRAAAELYIGHADNDRSMPPEQMARLTQALAEAHVRHTAELYVGAAHGWTQTDARVHDPRATERHWMRLLDLFGRVLHQRPVAE